MAGPEKLAELYLELKVEAEGINQTVGGVESQLDRVQKASTKAAEAIEQAETALESIAQGSATAASGAERAAAALDSAATHARDAASAMDSAQQQMAGFGGGVARAAEQMEPLRDRVANVVKSLADMAGSTPQVVAALQGIADEALRFGAVSEEMSNEAIASVIAAAEREGEVLANLAKQIEKAAHAERDRLAAYQKVADPLEDQIVKLREEAQLKEAMSKGNLDLVNSIIASRNARQQEAEVTRLTARLNADEREQIRLLVEEKTRLKTSIEQTDAAARVAAEKMTTLRGAFSQLAREVGGPFSIAMGGAVAAITMISTRAIKLAIDLDDASRRVAATSANLRGHQEEVERSLRDISADTGRSIREVSEAAVVIARGGVSGVNELAERLRVTSDLAKVTGQSFTAVAEGLDVVVDLFGVAPGAMRETAAELFAVHEQGVPLNDLFQTLSQSGRALVDSGLDLRSSLAAMGEMINRFGTARQAATEFRELVSLGEKGIEVLRQYAAQAGGAADKQQQFNEAMELIGGGLAERGRKSLNDFDVALTRIASTAKWAITPLVELVNHIGNLFDFLDEMAARRDEFSFLERLGHLAGYIYRGVGLPDKANNVPAGTIVPTPPKPPVGVTGDAPANQVKTVADIKKEQDEEAAREKAKRDAERARREAERAAEVLRGLEAELRTAEASASSAIAGRYAALLAGFEQEVARLPEGVRAAGEEAIARTRELEKQKLTIDIVATIQLPTSMSESEIAGWRDDARRQILEALEVSPEEAGRAFKSLEDAAKNLRAKDTLREVAQSLATETARLANSTVGEFVDLLNTLRQRASQMTRGIGDEARAEMEQLLASLDRVEMQQFAVTVAADLDLPSDIPEEEAEEFRRAMAKLIQDAMDSSSKDGSEALLANVTAAILEAQQRAAQLRQDSKDRAKALETARKETAAARETASAIQLASQYAFDLAGAFGLADDRTRSILKSVLDIASGIIPLMDAIDKLGKVDAKGNPLATLSTVLGAAGPIVAGISGFVGGIASTLGESPELKAARESLDRLRDSLEKNTATLRDLNLSGMQISGTGSSIDRFLAEGLPRLQSRSRVSVEGVTSELDRFGLSLEDIRELAAELNAPFIDLTRETIPYFIQMLLEFGKKLDEIASKGRYATDAMGRIQQAADEITFSVADESPGQVIRKYIEAAIGTGGPVGGSPILAAFFDGFDFDLLDSNDPAVRNAARETLKRIVESIYGAITSEGFDVAALGDFSFSNLTDFLQDVLGWIPDALDESGGQIATASDKWAESVRNIGRASEVFGYTIAEEAQAIVAAFASLSPELAGWFDGFDLSTVEGMSDAIAFLQDKFSQFSKTSVHGAVNELEALGLSLDDLALVIGVLHKALGATTDEAERLAEAEARAAEQARREAERAVEEQRRRWEQEQRERERAHQEEMRRLEEIKRITQALGSDTIRALEEGFRLFDITEPVDQLAQMFALLSKQAPVFRTIFGGLSAESAGDRAEALQRLRDFQLANPFGVESGSLSADAVRQQVLTIAELLKSANAIETTEAGSLGSFAIDRSITELRGERLEGLLSTGNIWLEDIATSNAAILAALTVPSGFTGITPPSIPIGSVAGSPVFNIGTISVVVDGREISMTPSSSGAQSIGQLIDSIVTNDQLKQLGAG